MKKFWYGGAGDHARHVGQHLVEVARFLFADQGGIDDGACLRRLGQGGAEAVGLGRRRALGDDGYGRQHRVLGGRGGWDKRQYCQRKRDGLQLHTAFLR